MRISDWSSDVCSSDLAPIPVVKVRMPPRELLLPALERVLYGGMIGEGEEVYALEREFASRFGLSNALAVSSGTAALHLAFLACGVRPGDEVITDRKSKRLNSSH